MLYGIWLIGGQEFLVDIIVMVMGLKMNVLGDIEFVFDGCLVDFLQMLIYKGMMFLSFLNFVYVFGYINLLWMFKVEFIVDYVCCLLIYMDRYVFCVVLL